MMTMLIMMTMMMINMRINPPTNPTAKGHESCPSGLHMDGCIESRLQIRRRRATNPVHRLRMVGWDRSGGLAGAWLARPAGDSNNARHRTHRQSKASKCGFPCKRQRFSSEGHFLRSVNLRFPCKRERFSK